MPHLSTSSTSSKALIQPLNPFHGDIIVSQTTVASESNANVSKPASVAFHFSYPDQWNPSDWKRKCWVGSVNHAFFNLQTYFHCDVVENFVSSRVCGSRSDEWQSFTQIAEAFELACLGYQILGVEPFRNRFHFFSLSLYRKPSTYCPHPRKCLQTRKSCRFHLLPTRTTSNFCT